MSLDPTASYYLLSQPAANLSKLETDIKDTFDQLADGHKFVKYEKDVTLFVGKSLAGTTTLLAHLTTDSSKLKVGRDGNKVVIQGQAIRRTIFPTLLGSGSHHFYDCPGFSNSRRLVDDISATYFIKKVVDQASRLRMVFVAENHLFEADTCPGLEKQLGYMTSVIKNYAPLRACMGMVVTKVPIEGKSDGQAAIKRIGDKLVSYKPKLEEAFAKEPEKRQAVGELVDLLTERDEDGVYRRLAVFFEPPAGAQSLDKIDQLQAEKPKIELMVQDLSFADRQTLNISYRLAPGSLEAVSSLKTQICMTLDEKMKLVGYSLKSFLDSMVESNDDVYDLRSKLQTNVEALKRLASALVELEDARIFELGLTSYLPALKIGAPQATLVEVSRYISYLQFLKEVSSEEITLVPSARTKYIREVIDHYEDELCWSQFVVGLFEDLSKHDVQKDRRKYDVENISLWGAGTESSKRGIHINAQNLSTFFLKLKEKSAPSYVTDRLCGISPTTVMLGNLNKVLELTLRQEVTWEPDLGSKNTSGKQIPKIEVQTCKAPVVRVGELMQRLNYWDYNFETLRIFASHKVILDVDLNLEGKKISILAPALELVDKKKVDVSGSPNSHVPARAKDGHITDGKKHESENGLAGGTGRDAGRVLLASLNRNQNSELSIMANGGNGGAGQDGGYGYKGERGAEAPAEYSGEEPKGFRFEMIRKVDLFDWIFYVGTEYHFRVTGGRGGFGGRGGNGGDGGKGGNSGHVVVDGVQASISAQPGDGGKAGRYGRGGEGGYTGLCRQHAFIYYKLKSNRWDPGQQYYDLSQSAAGQFGKWGSTGKPGVLAADNDKMALDLNAYKSYMLDSYGQGILRSQLASFASSINRSDNLRNLYGLYTLCDELLCYQGKYPITDLTVYEYLSDRIELFSKPERNLTDDEKKCLRYLYTATQTEICRLKSSKDKYLVINVEGYLEGALKLLKQLKTSLSAKTISSLRAKFGDEITRMVQEAYDLINAHLPKEIDEAMSQMKARIEAVLNEVSDMEKELEKDKAALEKLKYFSIGMFVLDIMNAMAGMLVLLGPIGAVLALGATVATQVNKKIVEAIVKPDLDRPDHITKVPEAVKKAKDYTSKAIKDEKKSIVSEADELRARIERMRKVLAPKQLESYASINSLAADNQSSMSAAEADRQLGQTLQTLSSVNEQSTSSLTDLNETVSQAESQVDAVAMKSEFFGPKTEKAAIEGRKVVKEIGDHVDKFTSKSGKISKALAQVDESLKNLDAYKKKIRAETLPMIDDLGNQMSHVQEQLIGQSQAALDIAKWNIGGCLSNMKFYLKGVTEGFKGQEEVERTVMKVDAAITTMISIFDRIQNYQSQARMADHIADVAAVGFDTIDIADPKLKELAAKMCTNMQESLMLERYGACYSAFRQWAFPLAYLYLPTITLPNGFKNAADLNPSDLESMLEVVNRYKTSVNPEDNTMVHDEFDTDVGELPFYTWTNASFSAQIAELLSGKEIRLMADIRNSPPSKDAIKFIRLGLKFRLGDKERSERLQSLLNGFKLSLRHSGTSHYRVRQEFYEIQSASVEIECKLRTKPDGSPVGRNAVYEKLLSGDQMLSPYTLWTIKLIKNNPGLTHESLESFGDVDLELVGEGWSFDTAKSMVDYQLDRYGYKRADFPLSIC